MRLFDEIGQLLVNPSFNLTFGLDLLKQPDIPILPCLLLLERIDKIDNTGDVIGQGNIAKGLNDSKHQGFPVVGDTDVPEADTKHGGHGPVVSPAVLLVPDNAGEVQFRKPVIPLIEVAHH